MAGPFSLKKERRADITVLTITGFVDAHTAPQFEKAIEEEIEAEHYRIIVDFENLEYISSAGIGVFMGFIEEVQEKNGDIKLCCLNDKIRDVFVLLGFEEFYDIVKDLPSAIERFHQSKTG